MMLPPNSTLRYCPRNRSATMPPKIAAAQALLPLLHVEMMLVQQGPPQHGRELVERGEQLGHGLAQRLRLEAAFGGAHVLQDALLGARRDDRLAASLHEHVGAAPGPALLL